jgi:hypothetical protein
MNNRRNSQVAAKKRRRRIRFGKKTEENRREQIASIKRGMIQHHAQFGGRSAFGMGSPIFTPKRTKFKGYMRTD